MSKIVDDPEKLKYHQFKSPCLRLFGNTLDVLGFCQKIYSK